MAITSNPNDKYALLFSGPADDRFLKDLGNVAEMLVQSYHYPPAHLRVVLGSVPAVMPGFSGAAVTTVGSAAGLAAALAGFAAVAAGPDKTALLYFTGGGIAPAPGSSDSQLAVTGGPAPAAVNAAWLAGQLNPLGTTNVNVVMQQSYAGGMSAALTGSTLTNWSLTVACGAHEDSYGDWPVAKGSFFTHAWTRGLKLEALPAGTADAGAYADELGGGSEGPNRLVSLEEAMAFGRQIHDDIDGMAGLSTPAYAGPPAGGAQYLGLPAFLIRDGSPWWESPDITLAHPNHPWVPEGDLYIPDPAGAAAPFNNTIKVAVRNVGCHPVRAFSLGIELFSTGAGGASTQHDPDPVVPAGGVLRPMDPGAIGGPGDRVHTYEWNALFLETATHRCVKAEARLLHGELDWAWNPAVIDCEGQRNIDEMPAADVPEAEFPEIQGTKEHLFGLENRFKDARRFLVAFPEEFLKLQQPLGLEWFELWQGKERVPLKIVEQPWPHLEFRLETKERRELLLRVAPKPGERLDEPLRLPFEIWVEGRWPGKRRPLFFPARMDRMGAIAGFTVVLGTHSSYLKGVVLDKGGKPQGKAQVHVRTANGLARAALWTREDGSFALGDVNPDVYLVGAEAGRLHSEWDTVVLLPDRGEEIKLVVR